MIDAQSVYARMESKFSPEPNTGCWLWTASVRNGYPCFGVKRNGSWKIETASRVMHEIHSGSHPGDMHVLHKCDNPICVNPEHLFLGTHLDNCEDRAQKNRGTKSKIGLPRGVAKSNDGFYIATCKHHGKNHYAGYYSSIEDAAEAASKMWIRVRSKHIEDC